MAAYDQTSTLRTLISQGVATTDRDAIKRSARNIIAEVIDPLGGIGSIIMIDGTVYYMAVGLIQGDVVTSLVININAAGSGMTLSKAGLYSSTGTLLASSVDQGSAWQSTGIKTIAMQTPYTVPVTGLYYVALVGKTGTTMPTPFRGGNSLLLPASSINSGKAAYYGQLSQTDLPSPATFADGVTTNVYWVAVI